LVKVGNGVVDVRVSAEVGDKVTSFWVFSSLRPVPMVLEILLSKIEVAIGSSDIDILWSKIGDEIVFLESSLLAFW
jgi:hypothetical protein